MPGSFSRHRPPLALLLVLLTPQAPMPCRAQAPPRGALERAASQRMADGFRVLQAMLSLPNDAHLPEQVASNAEWVRDAFASRGFGVRSLETGGPPLVLAERASPVSERTVLIYLQIDGQPVDRDAWHQEDPFVPVLKRPVSGGWEPLPWDRLYGPDRDPEWRVFARSTSDAKGPVAMFLTALDAMEAEGWEPTFGIKVIMDLEEELGSPHLPAAVRRYRDDLQADALLIFDGPRHQTNRPTLTFGARGIATITLTVFGPRAPQHSGHYGNYAPNPAIRLAEIIASFKDREGRVTIPGFYDGVMLTEADRREMALVPDDEEAIQEALGIAEPEAVGGSYQEAIQFPSLNVRGMASGWVGEEARTIVPAEATAEIDVRLVPASDPARLIGLIRSHIEDLGYHLLEGAPTEAERLRHPRLASFTFEVSYGAFRTPIDSETGRWLRRALRRAFGADPVLKRMSGGSIPISPFIETLGFPAVTVPTVNPDNNQHSPDENLRVGNFEEGVRTFLAILTQPRLGR